MTPIEKLRLERIQRLAQECMESATPLYTELRAILEEVKELLAG